MFVFHESGRHKTQHRRHHLTRPGAVTTTWRLLLASRVIRIQTLLINWRTSGVTHSVCDVLMS